MQEQRELERLRSLDKAKEKKALETVRPIKPTEKFRGTAKYYFELKQEPKGDLQASTNLDTVSDILGGTFRFGDNIKYTNKGFYTQTPYYQYSRRYQKSYALLEIGNTMFKETNLLIPDIYITNGIRLDSRERQYSSGIVDIQGYAELGTEIELYKDGIYVDTVKVDNNGKYIFKNVSITGFSSVYLKLYKSDGSLEIKRVHIANSYGNILKKGELEYRLALGTTEYGNIAYSALRYGVLNNLSFGIHPLYLPNSKAFSVMIDSSFQPMYGLSILGQSLSSFGASNTFDAGLRMDISWLYPNLLQFEFKHYQEDSPSLFRNTDYYGNKYLIRYSTNFAIFSLTSEYSYNTYSRLSNFVNVNLATKSRLYFKTDSNFDNALTSYELGYYYTLSYLSHLDITRSWGNGIPSTSLSYALYSFYDTPWTISSSLELYDDGNTDFTGEISYRYKYKLNTGIMWNKQYLGFKISYTDVISTKPHLDNWMNYNYGVLYGRVLDPDGKPLPNATVMAGALQTKTDKNGYYLLSGIRPYNKVKVAVNPAVNDITLCSEKEFTVFYFRPGSAIEYNPNIVHNVGIDGVLNTRISLKAAKILVYRLEKSTAKLIKENPIEEDGFFIIEGLRPGRYKLVLKSNTLKKLPRPRFISVKENTEWVSELKWNW